jgi:hypothetical protein
MSTPCLCLYGVVWVELYLTWMKCTSVSQRIIWSLWWASCVVSCGCQMGVCISRWKGKQRTQTGSQVTHVRTLLAMNWLWTCAELSSETGTASFSVHKILTQNLKILKCRKSVHSCYYAPWQRYTWQCLETARLHWRFCELEDEAVLHWRRRPIHMNLNWKDSDMNDSVRDHHTHENVDRNRFSWVSCSLWLTVTMVFSPHMLFFLALH